MPWPGPVLPRSRAMSSMETTSAESETAPGGKRGRATRRPFRYRTAEDDGEPGERSWLRQTRCVIILRCADRVWLAAGRVGGPKRSRGDSGSSGGSAGEASGRCDGGRDAAGDYLAGPPGLINGSANGQPPRVCSQMLPPAEQPAALRKPSSTDESTSSDEPSRAARVAALGPRWTPGEITLFVFNYNTGAQEGDWDFLANLFPNRPVSMLQALYKEVRPLLGSE